LLELVYLLTLPSSNACLSRCAREIVGETLYVLAVGHDAMEEGLARRIG
jgi:hypothetical protein